MAITSYLCIQGERSSDPTRDWPRLACKCTGVSSGGLGQRWPAAGVTECGSACMGPFEGVPHIFIAFTIVWPQVKIREGTQPHPSTENWIKDLLSMATPVRTRVSHSVSFSHQEASTNLLPFSIRGQTDWKPRSQETIQSDHMDHSLVKLNETMRHAV